MVVLQLGDLTPRLPSPHGKGEWKKLGHLDNLDSIDGFLPTMRRGDLRSPAIHDMPEPCRRQALARPDLYCTGAGSVTL